MVSPNSAGCPTLHPNLIVCLFVVPESDSDEQESTTGNKITFYNFQTSFIEVMKHKLVVVVVAVLKYLFGTLHMETGSLVTDESIVIVSETHDC